MVRLARIHNVAGTEGPVLTVDSGVVDREKPVYFHVVDRLLRYQHGYSRIVYIGTTETGLERIMSSIAERAEDAFRLHGVNRIEVHEIGCRPRQKVRMWTKLERACLLTFREIYGEVPRLNTHGKGYEEEDEFEYFNKNQIRRFILKWNRGAPKQ